jgi:hypothetical protein
MRTVLHEFVDTLESENEKIAFWQILSSYLVPTVRNKIKLPYLANPRMLLDTPRGIVVNKDGIISAVDKTSEFVDKGDLTAASEFPALEDVTDGAEEPHKTKEAIEALRARLSQQACNRCGKVNPAEIHTCTPLDPLLEALRVPDYSKAGFASPQREWVGLTDEDIRNIAAQRTDFSRPAYEEYYIAIEQALKDKNT